MDLTDLYRQLVRAREYEKAVAELWNRGLVLGEMHAGTGEEAVAAGVVTHLTEEDALALTHRASPFLVVRGVPLVPMLKELLGREDGLCGGKGGHMHLFSKTQRVATSGIVGASLPAAAGFALAAKRLRTGSIAIAQTGDGALNQGMALEVLNLAVAWSLPLLVVCIDNGWAITTPAGTVTGGELQERARAFGWAVESTDGTDVTAVHDVAGKLIHRLRRNKGPAFLHVTTPRMDGHVLGDMLVRVAREPLGEGRDTMSKVMGGAMASHGGGLMARAAGVTKMMGVMGKVRTTPRVGGHKDPVVIAAKKMKKSGHDTREIDEAARSEVAEAVASATEGLHGA